MNIKTILVATDFSDDAHAALDTAIEFAKTFAAKIRLLHAYHLEVPTTYAGFGNDYVIPQDIIEPIRKGAEATMEKLIDDLSKKGVEVDGIVVMEYPSRAILDEATRLPADLIVMGTRGLTGIKHVLLGSTAERVIRLAKCPVLTINAAEAESR